jgi:hypothetical protein
VFGDDLKPFLPSNIQPFSLQLKQFPEHFEKWVHASSLPNNIFQGDVLKVAPIVIMEETGKIHCLDLPAMIISCSCDVQPGQAEVALVAPVFDLEDYKKNSELTSSDLDEHIRSLKANKIANLFFLPAGVNLKASVVDFANISPISVEFLHSQLKSARLTSLSQLGHYIFVVKLAYHFTRPEPADAVRA